MKTDSDIVTCMSDRNARCVQCSATLVPCATESFVETWAIAFSCSVARRKYQSAGCLKQVPYFGPPKPKPKAKPGRLPSLERPTSAPSATAGGEAASPIYKHSFAQMISRIVVCAAGGDAGDDAAQEEKERVEKMLGALYAANPSRAFCFCCCSD